MPDHVSSIQGALNARVDTVLVQPGFYNEDLLLFRQVVIAAVDTTRPPQIKRLNIEPIPLPDVNRVFALEYCRIDSGVTVNNDSRPIDIDVSACTIAGGISDVSIRPETATLRIVRSQIYGDIGILVRGSCSIESSHLTGHAAVGREDAELVVRNCTIEGDGTGIWLRSIGRINTATLQHNLVRSFEKGIEVSGEVSVQVSHNVVASCSAVGIGAADYRVVVESNRIVDCGLGVAVEVEEDAAVRNNHIVRSTRDAIRVRSEWGIEVLGNVSSHCLGEGLSVAGHVDAVCIAGNTIVGCAGNGIVVDLRPESTRRSHIEIARNISAWNGGYGLAWIQGFDSTVVCNDWFNNGLGAVSGVSMDPTDLSVDPLFCSADGSDLHLMANSPLLDALGCGLIGALGVGCGVTAVMVAVFRAEGVEGGIQIEWRWGGIDPPTETWIERADDSDSRWERVVTERGEQDGTMTELDRNVEPGRTYIYHLSWMTEAGDVQSSEEVSVTALGSSDLVVRRVSPNPSRGPVEIEWSLRKAGSIDIAVYDIAGREVAQLATGMFGAGRHQTTWDPSKLGRPAAAGLYLVRLRYDGREVVRRLLLRR